MADPTLSVAVIGAGMAGRSHAAAYRAVNTVFGEGLPPVRLAAIADANTALAEDGARRYGFEKAVSSWEAVAGDPDIDAVSIVVGNTLHRPIAEALVAAGKHVLCEKPLAGSMEDARLVGLAGATNVGAEMDPPHLMWQGMDVVACIRRLGPLVFHAAAKDAMITPGVDVRGVLDTSFERVPADAEDKVPTGIGHWCNAWPENPAWRFVAVGVGHDVDYWTEFLRALGEIDPDMAVNIEHEDASYSRLDGLALAAENLSAAAAKV